jgi:ergothioneine biosynthesis protein EgtB
MHAHAEAGTSETGHKSISELYAEYANIRNRTTALMAPLSTEDCCVHSLPDASPIKWHLGHVAWFFETFVLAPYETAFKPFHPAFPTMFSSYNKEGKTHPDPKRGLFTRPSLAVIQDYCRNVDERLHRLLHSPPDDAEMLHSLTVLGLNHEQQHQELMLADIKHLLSQNPLGPCYRLPGKGLSTELPTTSAIMEWHDFESGIIQIGYAGQGFCYDNESPRHKQYLEPYRLASRLVTNGEFLQFIEAGGYQDSSVWLSEGWDWLQSHNQRHPIYWHRNDQEWQEFTLMGRQPLQADLPLVHVSYYEADAYARWAGARLPTEAEWENASSRQKIDGNFAENGHLHPSAADPDDSHDSRYLAQLYGDVWEWTQSSYSPYPGYSPAKANASKPISAVWDEAVGEYNSRSMVNQYVLRGGSCITPIKHIRPSFRNFFPAKTCWQFSGIRLARDI